MRSDLFEMLEDLRAADPQRTMQRCLNSNGALLTETTARRLGGLVDEIRVSIDALEDRNDLLRGAGSFRMAMDALATLERCGFEPMALVTVTAISLPDLESLLCELLERGWVGIRLNPVRPIGRAGAHRELRVDPELARAAIRRAWARMHPGRLFPPPRSRPPTQPSCGVGSTVNIMPNGDAFPCHVLTGQAFSLGNIRARPLTEICARGGSLCALRRLDFRSLGSEHGDLAPAARRGACLGEVLAERVTTSARAKSRQARDRDRVPGSRGGDMTGSAREEDQRRSELFKAIRDRNDGVVDRLTRPRLLGRFGRPLVDANAEERRTTSSYGRRGDSELVVPALHVAVEAGHLVTVNLLLDRGADPDARGGSERETALHLALARGLVQIAAVLVERGASVGEGMPSSDAGESHFVHAVRCGQLHIAERVLSKGVDINARSNKALLGRVVQSGKRESLQFLLERGMRVGLDDALHVAARRRDTASAQLLLAAGANVDARDDHDRTALLVAASGGDVARVEWLLRSGANPNAPSGDGVTPLAAAAEAGESEAVEALLGGGASTNGAQGADALSCAARGGQRATVERLLAHGVDVATRDREHATALHRAAGAGHADLIDLLVSRGAPVDGQDHAGETPLHLAVRSEHPDAAKQLISLGADPLVENTAGETALDLDQHLVIATALVDSVGRSTNRDRPVPVLLAHLAVRSTRKRAIALLRQLSASAPELGLERVARACGRFDELAKVDDDRVARAYLSWVHHIDVHGPFSVEAANAFAAMIGRRIEGLAEDELETLRDLRVVWHESYEKFFSGMDSLWCSRERVTVCHEINALAARELERRRGQVGAAIRVPEK